MEQNKYRQAMELVTTPPELRARTRNMLIAEKQRNKSKTFRMVGVITSIAALFVLVIGISIWFIAGPGSSMGFGDLFNPGASSVSSTQKEIDLNFVSLSDDTEPVRMAYTYPLRQQMSLNDFSDILPEEPPGGFDSPDGAITAFFSVPSDTPDALLGEAIYRASKGATISVMFSDTQMFYLPVEISGSFIDDVEVGVGYSESDGRLFASYEKNGFTFLLISEGLNRKEFAQVLVHFVAN